jgi:hypothetical protein
LLFFWYVDAELNESGKSNRNNQVKHRFVFGKDSGKARDIPPHFLSTFPFLENVCTDSIMILLRFCCFPGASFAGAPVSYGDDSAAASYGLGE